MGEGFHRVGFTAFFQGDLSGVQRFTQLLDELAERLGDNRLRALARSNRAYLEGEIGDIVRALALADEALGLMRQVGDAYAYAFLQNVKGELARLSGDPARAKVAYEAELRLAEQLGAKRLIAVGTGNMGAVSADVGDWNAALQWTKTALQINQSLGEDLNLRSQLFSAAEAVMHLGDPDLAARLMGAVEASFDELPVQYYAPDRKPMDRFRHSIAEKLPPERLQRLRREGAGLTLEEAVLRVVAFHPSTS